MSHQAKELALAIGLMLSGGWLVFWVLIHIAFVAEKHRLPDAAGELINWLFGFQ